MQKIKEILEGVFTYTQHSSECLYSQWRQGKPTDDGDYLTLFGYGKEERWYSRNKKEFPKCSCGLEALENTALSLIEKEIQEMMLSEEEILNILIERDKYWHNYDLPWREGQKRPKNMPLFQFLANAIRLAQEKKINEKA